MIRLVLLFAFLLILAAGALFLLGLLRWVSGPASPKGVDTLPDTFRTIAYIILIVLMFGITSGFLGGV